MNLIYRNSFIEKRHSKSKLDKTSLTSNTSLINLENRSIIFDATYNLFKKIKNKSKSKNVNNKIKIKKIETSNITKNKYRNKTTNLRTYTDISNKTKKLKHGSIYNKKLNKINSIIININNSQINKTSFRNNTNEKNYKNNDNNENYFYDFSLSKIKIKEYEFKNNIKNYYNNTYNVGNKNNNYYKKKIKLNKNHIKEKLNFNLSQKKPIKIKTNIVNNKIKNKSYIQKNKNIDNTFNKSINNEIKNKNQLLHKLYYSKSFNITMQKNEKNNMTHKKMKTAEKNYLEKWQLMNNVNIEKKYSLSYINSKKQITKIPQKLNSFEKNNAFSQRQKKTLNNNYFGQNYNNIKVVNTEINEDNKKKDYFLDKTLQKNKKHNNFESENKKNSENKINNIINNNDNIVENKINEIENLNKIIERKKREIDLLNVMKFTSSIYNSKKRIDKDIDIDINLNEDNSKSLILNDKNNKKDDFNYENQLYFNYNDNFINFNNKDENINKHYTFLNYNNELNEDNDIASIINIDSNHKNNK